MKDHTANPRLTAYFNSVKAAQAAGEELVRHGVQARVEPVQPRGHDDASSAGALLFADEVTPAVRGVIAQYHGKVRESELREPVEHRGSRI
jgi:hypothetical protein